MSSIVGALIGSERLPVAVEREPPGITVSSENRMIEQ
jgi:hypothetical protein